MKDVEWQTYFRTGRRCRRCPQGPDLVLSKPTPTGTLLKCFIRHLRTPSRSYLKKICRKLHRISAVNCTGYLLSKFHDTACGTFLCGNENHKSSDSKPMRNYDSRRPSCVVESVQKVCHSSFPMYTGPQSHYTERTINKKDPEWLYDCAKLREEHLGQRIV